jgi:acetylornithine deacetylase/succinyl-diaminopimelate desuccinylase-like protein
LVPGPDLSSDRSDRSDLSDKDLVESVLRELNDAADRWEALVAQAENVTYSVDMGDVQAVANSDGKLLGLTLHPDVMTGYTHGELSDRLNSAIAALREEAVADNHLRYGEHLL